MADEELNNLDASEEVTEEAAPKESVPVGIARVREEWRAAGLKEVIRPPQAPEPIIFTEIDGGAGIGDYTLETEEVQNTLGLAPDAVERLITSGEIDSVLVQGVDGAARRLLSESSVKRFREDAAIDPEAIKRAARAMADKTLVESIEELRAEVEEIQGNQAKVIQQMKDMLLLEIRNLKEQDRDLTSFVYELAEEIRGALGKKRR